MKKSNTAKSKEDRVEKGNSKSKFSNGKRKGKFSKDKFDDTFSSDKRVCAGSKPNDPKWYALNEQLLKDAASFPYAWPLGNKLNFGQYTTHINRGSLPGVMTMHWIPTIGYSEDPTSAVNVASINTYTKVRHDNSGHANYDHADYMLYLLAMDSVYAMHAWMRRAYGVALTYSNVNRYYPRAVIQSMGIDFADLQSNLANFRAYINQYAVKASALAVPAKMSYMTKHYWMSEGLYYDSMQDKAQTYLFNPLYFYQFQLSTDEVPVGKLVPKPLFGTRLMNGFNIPKTAGEAMYQNNLKVADIIKYADELLAPIIADEDFGIMSGDTLKSFGVGGCYTLPFTEETYTVLPSYVPEVLDQIQNATFIGMPNLASAEITQDVSSSIGSNNLGTLISKPTFTHPWTGAPEGAELPGQNAFICDRFLTFTHGDIQPANTMEASRWTNIGTEVTESRTTAYFVPTVGSEAMCCGTITYHVDLEGNGNFNPITTGPIYVSIDCDIFTRIGSNVNVSSPTDVQNLLTKLCLQVRSNMADYNMLVQQLSVFDRHPTVMLSAYSGFSGSVTVGSNTAPISDNQYVTVNGFLGDINYYTVLNSRDLEAMSRIALLSEFDVTIR